MFPRVAFLFRMIVRTHTHPFNGPFSETTRVSRYQRGKTNLDFTEARDSEWQWQQLDHMQVCTSLQTDDHPNNPQQSVFLQAGCPSCHPTNSIIALKADRSQLSWNKSNNINLTRSAFALTTVLYRDLPKYNDRRRSLWLPEIVHQQAGMRRTISNPSLYGLDQPVSSRYSALVETISLWSGAESCDKGAGLQRRRAGSVQSLISNSTGSCPSNYSDAV